MQGNALIRANFSVDPDTLDSEKWARLFCEAVWLENNRLLKFGELMAQMWSG